MKCSKLNTGLWTNFEIEDWADFVDEVLQTEECTVMVNHVVDCSEDDIDENWSEQHGDEEEYSIFGIFYFWNILFLEYSIFLN